ncbi:MAG: RNA polymerase sigma factor [Niabella sp.]
MNIGDINKNRVVDAFYQFESSLFMFAQKITRSESLAQDIIQELFLSLWEKRDMLEQIENIEAYLYRSVKNKSIDFLRTLANDQKLRTNYFSSIEFEDNSLEHHISTQEFNQLFHAAIEKLPEKRRQIYELSQIEGLSRKEIAEKMSISESTVKNQITSANASIKDFLIKYLKSLILFF